MGNAASLFDCAVNPLHPSMPDDTAAVDDDGVPKPYVLDAGSPLRDSVIWRLQASFYRQHAVSAWSEGIVPNFVTSNSYIARAYAKVVLGVLRDVYAGGGGGAGGGGCDPTQPVYIIEVGAGHG